VPYEVDVISTSFRRRVPSARRLQKALDRRSAAGWQLSWTIRNERRVLRLLRRNAHFLVFERVD
jgi:hypothetical protein